MEAENGKMMSQNSATEQEFEGLRDRIAAAQLKYDIASQDQDRLFRMLDILQQQHRVRGLQQIHIQQSLQQTKSNGTASLASHPTTESI